MAFQQTQFLGASISSFTTNVGWGGNPSQLSCVLVEDPTNNDLFSNPPLGSPRIFSFGDFSFGGIVKNYTYNEGEEKTYTVQIDDPREILQGVMVILDGYHGSVSNQIHNVINAIYFYENGTFGLSPSSDAGYTWSRTNSVPLLSSVGTVNDEIGLRRAILETINGPKPIKFNNHYFRINLDNLPQMSPHYRIQGDVISLLDIITQICNDAGFDYIFEIIEPTNDHHVIKIKTIDRTSNEILNSQVNQQSVIKNFIESKRGTELNSFKVGYELNTDKVSTFLFGGNEQRIQESTSIKPYWGLDNNNDPVITEDYHYSRIVAVDCRSISDQLPVRDNFGIDQAGVRYNATVGEMRFVLTSEQSWHAYLQMKKPDMAKRFGLSSIDPKKLKNLMDLQLGKFDGQGWYRDAAGSKIETNDMVGTLHRFYFLLRSVAEKHFGKTFWCVMPHSHKVVDEATGKEMWSLEIIDGGVSDSPPIEVPALVSDLYQTSDGLYTHFVRYDNVSEADTSVFSSDTIYTEDGTNLFMACSVSPNMVNHNGDNGAIITVESPVFKKRNGIILSNIDEIVTLLDGNNQTRSVLQKANKSPQWTIPFDIHTQPSIPARAAIAYIDNTTLYGPWYVQNENGGPVAFEINQSLVPWNHGGTINLNLAANAMISQSSLAQQVTQYADINLAGSPIINLGDKLIEGGPVVTSISCSINDNGVTTQYRMSTFTPSIGQIPKIILNKINSLGKSANSVNFKAKALARSEIRPDMNYLERFSRTSEIVSLNDARTKAITISIAKLFTPHGMMVGGYIGDEEEQPCYIASQTLQEAYSKLNPTGLVGAISMDGLFRPFVINSGNLPKLHNNNLPHDTGCLDASKWSPYTSSNLVSNARFMYAGTSFDDHEIDTSIYATGNPSLINGAKGVGFKAPQILVGWGYDLKGTPISGVDQNDAGSWKAGPLETMWDNNRKMWSSPGNILTGIAISGIPPRSTGIANVETFGRWNVWNKLNQTVPTNATILLGYDTQSNNWVVVASDCE